VDRGVRCASEEGGEGGDVCSPEEGEEGGG